MECAAIVVVVVVVWGVPGVAPAAGGDATIVVTNKLWTCVGCCLRFSCAFKLGFFVRLGAVPSFLPIATPTHVDEKSVKVGGTQLITTLDGYSVPLLIKDGLAYATSLGRPTNQDMDTYPHIFFTSIDEWDPSVLDHDPPHLDGLDLSQVPDQPFGDPMFDAYGDFNKRIIANLNILLDAPPEDCGSYTEISSVFTANLHQSSPQ